MTRSDRPAGISILQRLLCGGVLAALTAGGAGAAAAQGVDCSALYAVIQAPDDPGRNAGQFAIQKQRAEIDRTQRYADQLGCDGGLFSDPPPQCGSIMDRLQAMQDNLASMSVQNRQGGGEAGRRAALVARYNAACVGIGGGNPADLAQRGDRGFLLEDGQNSADALDPDGLSTVPLNGDIMDGSGGGGGNRGQAICVRTCDGGYFPLTRRASEDQLDGLEQLCQASCPNTEAKLYTMPQSDDLSSATAVDGTAYTALPAAFQFEKSFAATCTCKPPNRSWTEALADAEKLLGDPGRHDITVTAALSDQMAKPGAAPVSKVKGGKPPRGQKAPPPVPETPDLSVARDGQKALQAPTASNETTGIGGPVQPARVVREGDDGPTVAVDGPDGVKKRIRLIVP